MELDLRWTETKDFNALLDFYVTELVKYPDYIAHPELREGLKTEPAKWVPALKNSAVAYFSDTFAPNSNLRLAVLETQVKVNGAKKGTKKKPAPLPQIVAFVRIRTEKRAATIVDILVAEHLRGQGWGSKLMAFVQQGLESEGIVEVNLSVSINNADGARFFVRNGYMPYASFFAKILQPPPPKVHRAVATSGFGATDE